MRWSPATDESGCSVHIGVDAAGELWISENNQQTRLGVATDARASLQGGRARIELPNGRLVLSDDMDTAAAWFAGLRTPRKVRSPLTITLAMLAGFILLLYVLIRFVVPTLGDWAAGWIPPSLEQKLQGPVRESLASQGFGVSELPVATQAHYRQLFDRLVADLPDRSRYALEFRSFAAPNAFAMPGGVIVFTDPMFPLLDNNDDEFLAVAAHEIGHVEKRHIVRSLLRASTLTLLAAVVFGDVGSAVALANSVPGLLLNSAYSRDFEREADDFAFAMLKRQGRKPQALGTFLAKLSEQTGGDMPGVLRYASSHPATAERIEAAQAANATPRP